MSLVENALARLPDSLRRPLMLAVIQASVEPLDNNDAVATATKQAFDLSSSPEAFALDLIGALISQPRKQAQSDDDYLRAINGRIITRLSRGTLPDVKRLAKFVAETYGDGGFRVQSPAPKTIVVYIGTLTNDPGELDIVARLFLAAIGEVDRFDLVAIPANPFTWNVDGLGWSQGTWATSVFTTY